ncbi:6924_t:CDS:1, partial [Acaulospora morrowiae]
MPQLTIEQKAQTVILMEEGYSLRAIGNHLGVHHSTILRLKKKIEKTGSIKRKLGSGRPRKLSKREERECVRKILRGECSTAISVQKKLFIDN